MTVTVFITYVTIEKLQLMQYNGFPFHFSAPGNVLQMQDEIWSEINEFKHMKPLLILFLIKPLVL